MKDWEKELDKIEKYRPTVIDGLQAMVRCEDDSKGVWVHSYNVRGLIENLLREALWDASDLLGKYAVGAICEEELSEEWKGIFRKYKVEMKKK